MNNNDLIRSLALIGARARLAELEAAVKETKETIRLLQQAGSTGSKPRPKDGRRKRKVRRTHSPEFKAQIVQEAKAKGITATAAKHRLSRSLVDNWIAKAKGG